MRYVCLVSVLPVVDSTQHSLSLQKQRGVLGQKQSKTQQQTYFSNLKEVPLQKNTPGYLYTILGIFSVLHLVGKLTFPFTLTIELPYAFT